MRDSNKYYLHHVANHWFSLKANVSYNPQASSVDIIGELNAVPSLPPTDITMVVEVMEFPPAALRHPIVSAMPTRVWRLSMQWVSEKPDPMILHRYPKYVPAPRFYVAVGGYNVGHTEKSSKRGKRGAEPKGQSGMAEIARANATDTKVLCRV